MELRELDSLLLDLESAGEDPVLDWEEVFGNRNPVELEIGIGKGRFLIDAAQRLPQVNFVGVEWASKYLRIAHRRSLRRGLYNIRLVQADAREFVEFFVPAGSLQAIHIYFPDPWPKKKHHKRRLFNEEFLREVERVLRPSGLLWVATDYAEYFGVMLDLLAESRCMVEAEIDWNGVRTNYEEKFLAQGKEIYRRVWEKQEGDTPGV